MSWTRLLKKVVNKESVTCSKGLVKKNVQFFKRKMPQFSKKRTNFSKIPILYHLYSFFVNFSVDFVDYVVKTETTDKLLVSEDFCYEIKTTCNRKTHQIEPKIVESSQTFCRLQCNFYTISETFN